jgi:hypothetical protein
MNIWRGIKERWAFGRELSRQRKLEGRTVNTAAIKEHRKTATHQHSDPGSISAGVTYFSN